jgi:hypothetical protein
MRSNEINPSTNPQSVHSVVQTIAGEIATSSISLQKYQVLTRKLNDALETLKEIEGEEKAARLFAKAQAEYLKEQVVKLYGDLENGLVKKEISQIQEESSLLKQGNLTLKAIQQLETHITEIEENHLTLAPERRIIADAKQVLLEAKAKLEGKPVIKHFDFLASQKDLHQIEEAPLLPGEMEELLDIGRAVYNRDFRQAKMRYLSLHADHKYKFEAHMRNLMAVPFDDSLETIQALIATVNELLGNGEGYPTNSQIDRLFLGLSQCSSEEKEESVVPTEGKIVSLKFRKP